MVESYFFFLGLRVLCGTASLAVLLLFTEFGVSGFPAVGDLGHELANSFDVSLSDQEWTVERPALMTSGVGILLAFI